jgi:dephospho-CoA kinase
MMGGTSKEHGMIVVALTGGIASGKTTVGQMFAEEGALVIDFDALSRAVVEPQKPAWHEIVHTFGKRILRTDGAIDRNRLGRIVFSDPEKRKKLEQIVHPRVLNAYEEQIRRIREKNRQAIVVADVPLLMETRIEARFEKVIVVYAPPESQRMRLLQRNGSSRRSARDRLASQMPLEEKVRDADFVIDNGASLEETRHQVKQVYRALKMLEREKGQGGCL